MSSKVWKEFLPSPAGRPFALLDGEPPDPGLWWLPDEPEILDHWVFILRNNFDYLVHLVEQGREPARIGRAREARTVFRSFLDDLPTTEGREASPTIHHVTLFRESLVRAYELGDPYDAVKRKESDAAMERLRSNPAEWGLGGSAGRRSEEVPPACVPLHLLAQLMSGNLFDLGSALTQKAFREGSMNLEEARVSMRRRIVEIDPIGSRELERQGWRRWLLGAGSRDAAAERGGRILIFVDNAGSDFVLGILPLAVCMTEGWSEVVLAANSTPSSNDITVHEAREVLDRLRDLLAHVLEPGRLKLVQTGTGTPGIDLAHVGDELNTAAKGADALFIEGQGRGVETTWGARFCVPVLRLAVLKDPAVAAAIGRKLWDPLVVRQVPGAGAGAPRPPSRTDPTGRKP